MPSSGFKLAGRLQMRPPWPPNFAGSSAWPPDRPRPRGRARGLGSDSLPGTLRAAIPASRGVVPSTISTSLMSKSAWQAGQTIRQGASRSGTRFQAEGIAADSHAGQTRTPIVRGYRQPPIREGGEAREAPACPDEDWPDHLALIATGRNPFAVLSRDLAPAQADPRPNIAQTLHTSQRQTAYFCAPGTKRSRYRKQKGP